jgi:hypothetical protein
MSHTLKTLVLIATLSASAAPAKEITLPAYLDNRSTAVDVIESYYNALSLQQYARAFTYTLHGTPEESAEDLSAAYSALKDQFDDVTEIRMRRGKEFTSAGTGLEMTAIPVISETRDAAGKATVYATCNYVVQLSPNDQDFVPFNPIRIDHIQPEIFDGDFDSGAMPDCRF